MTHKVDVLVEALARDQLQPRDTVLAQKAHHRVQLRRRPADDDLGCISAKSQLYLGGLRMTISGVAPHGRDAALGADPSLKGTAAEQVSA